MTGKETSWVRYRHKHNRAIEYDVEVDRKTGALLEYVSWGIPCYRIRTVRNINLDEGVHQSAFTMMPADRFLDLYEVADGGE